MIPRTPILARFHGCLRLRCAPDSFSYQSLRSHSSRQFSQTFPAQAKKARPKHRNPYVLAQAQQRTAANKVKQAGLQEARKAALGDPVRGYLTSFTQSLTDTVPKAADPFLKSFRDISLSETSPSDSPEKPCLNHYLTPAEVEASLQYSEQLIQPPAPSSKVPRDWSDQENDVDEHAKKHSIATEAIKRIVTLENSTTAERTRANVQRCIEVFGRHNTDKYLKPRARAEANGERAETMPRIGRDTGSSEVQIALLTQKIEKLVTHMEKRTEKGKRVNPTDQHSKRSLRLLVHKRQKLLRYLRRKERGGERWQHAVSLLGLPDGTWKGEITV
ncbi:MAG: hypothetical protein M1814_002679 [Vezdaea aestivalis]|nr:MAG: hypothetical protein M1814_002679 [Vezdaea aestivalis]